MPVIPWAQFTAHQKGAGDKFAGEDKQRVRKAPYQEMPVPQKPTDRGKKSSHTIYREHPYGSLPV